MKLPCRAPVRFPRPFANSRSLTTLALPLVLLAACSGGGSSGSSRSTPPANRTLLVVDGNAGLDGALTGRLHAVAVEDAQGRIGPNLVEGNPEIVLNDPLGSHHGLQVRNVHPGAAALHLLFLPGSLKFHDPNGGSRDMRVQGDSLRIPFSRLATPAGLRRLFLRHRAPCELRFDRNSGQIDGTLTVEPTFPLLLRNTPVVVVQVDKTSATFEATIPSLGGMPAIFQLSSRSILIDGSDGGGDDEDDDDDDDDDNGGDGDRGGDEEQLSVAQFLGRIGAGSRVGVYGVMEALGDVVLVTAAEILPPPGTGSGKGNKNKVRGVLTDVRDNGKVCDIRVTEILIGGRDFPKDLPVMAKVWAQDAKIKWLPRFGRHRGHLPPSALEKDMLVEVEWLGTAANLEIPAKKINIRSRRRAAFLHSVSGRIDGVTFNTGVVEIVPLGTAPLGLGKESFSSLQVEVTGETVLVQDTQGKLELIDLTSVEKGQEVHLLGIRETGNTLSALLLQVRR